MAILGVTFLVGFALHAEAIVYAAAFQGVTFLAEWAGDAGTNRDALPLRIASVALGAVFADAFRLLGKVASCSVSDGSFGAAGTSG